MKVEDIKKQYYQEYCIDWVTKFGTFRSPNGESVQEATDRMYRELLKIAENNPGKTILVTSHGAIIRGFWGKISGIAPEDLADNLPFPTNASYSTLYYKDGKLVPVKRPGVPEGWM